MRFIVMHKVDARMEAGEPPAETIIKGMGKLVQSGLQSGVFKDGAGLHRSAQRARITPDGMVTRGPYAGANELVAGFAMVKAATPAHAIELASRLGGEVEIGPVVEPWDLRGAPRPADAPQRFLLLRKGEEAPPVPVLDEWKRDGVLLSSATLAPSAQGARYRVTGGKREWTDGPFAESKELIAGFSILELPAIADAKQWAEGYAAILGDNEVDVRVVVGP